MGRREIRNTTGSLASRVWSSDAPRIEVLTVAFGSPDAPFRALSAIEPANDRRARLAPDATRPRRSGPCCKSLWSQPLTVPAACGHRSPWEMTTLPEVSHSTIGATDHPPQRRPTRLLHPPSAGFRPRREYPDGKRL